jgi:hypothetical protein
VHEFGESVVAAAEQAVAADRDTSSRARRTCAISLCTCVALHTAARRRATAALGDDAMNVRKNVLSYLELLSQPSQQIQYEAKVPIANIQGDLVSQFCDDIYRPKNPFFLDAFTEDELKDLARLYGLLMESGSLRVSSVTQLLKQPHWRRTVAFAKDLAATLGAGN